MYLPMYIAVSVLYIGRFFTFGMINGASNTKKICKTHLKFS